jgi:feruloyl esterase
MPAFCVVTGYVWPQVGITLILPEQWNGKFIERGCGSHCGGLPQGEEVPLVFGEDLRKGYASIASDMGHRGSGADALWASNNLQAKLDFGIRATHVTALAGKAIVERYYHRQPTRSYFIGTSTGGRQGLQAAQRFPWDFDGIVAVAPVDPASFYLNLAWGIRVLHDRAGHPLLTLGDLKRLTDAAVAKCDLDDGVKDGVIGDPASCAFDPEELTCSASQTHDCLSAVQVVAVKKVYVGPMSRQGAKLSLGGPLVGSEFGEGDRVLGNGWFGMLGLDPGHQYEKIVTGAFQHLLLDPEPGPSWKLADLDFDRDSRRVATMMALYDRSNPDLRAFKRRGGKLLVFQGLSDKNVVPENTIDYYETVERTMGGRSETQDFFRLFLLSGVGHAEGGPGADMVDYETALSDWVEDRNVPERLIAAHLKTYESKQPVYFPLNPSQVQFTRPLYPYPARPKYSGHGDPNDAQNFQPVPYGEK